MRSWKRYVAAFIINIVVTIVVLLIRGGGFKIYYVDALSVAGSVSILLGLLVWITEAGAFDTIGYGLSTFRSERKYQDLYEYSLLKKEKRSRKDKPFLPYIVVGAVFLLLSLLVSCI